VTPDGDVSLLERLLLDPSGGVRALARWRWTRLFGPLTDIYRTALDEATTTAGPGRISHAVVALEGLGDYSLPDAVPHGSRLVADPSPRVRATAVQVLGRALQRYQADVDALLSVLDDPANRVVALAVRYLPDRAGEVPVEIVARLSTSPRPRDRITALRFRQRLGAWERVRSDLNAMRDDDPEVRDLGRSDLLAWLQNGAASTYGQFSTDQREDISASLATSRRHPHRTPAPRSRRAAGPPAPRTEQSAAPALEVQSPHARTSMIEKIRGITRRRS
jgi:HEAT repeat protein